MSDNFDYSQLTANTGIANIADANPNLDGTSAVPVLTASGSGTIIKSVTIKSAPTVANVFPSVTFSQEGIVRLFIQNADASITTLYKEVPIPAVPALPAVPLPAPVFSTFETVLTGDLKLNAGFTLLASTQFADSFNIFAEGLDCDYPDIPPAMCCTLVQEVANTGINVVHQADPYDFDGSGTLVNIFEAGASVNGSMIKSITIKAMQSTHAGMVRLYINSSKDDTNYLIREIHIPQTEQSGYVPSFKQVIEMNFTLESGYIIAASTQNAEKFSITIEAEDWIYP